MARRSGASSGSCSIFSGGFAFASSYIAECSDAFVFEVSAIAGALLRASAARGGSPKRDCFTYRQGGLIMIEARM